MVKLYVLKPSSMAFRCRSGRLTGRRYVHGTYYNGEDIPQDMKNHFREINKKVIVENKTELNHTKEKKLIKTRKRRK